MGRMCYSQEQKKGGWKRNKTSVSLVMTHQEPESVLMAGADIFTSVSVFKCR